MKMRVIILTAQELIINKVILKTFLIVGMCFVVILLKNSSAYAVPAHTYYVGANLSYNFPKYQAMNGAGGDVLIYKIRPGFGFVVGSYLEENIGLEFGYDHVTRVSGTNSSSQNVTARLNNIYLDVVGNKVISNKFDLVGTLGLGKVKPKITLNNDSFANNKDFNEARYGYRLGIGLLYKIRDDINAKAMLRYQHGKSSFLKGVPSVSIGLNYLWM